MKYDRSVYQSLMMVTQFGINMIVPILLCTMLGVWLGKLFHAPILAIPLFFMGALAGGRSVYKLIKKIYDTENEDKGDV
ncbi:hypothetical protein FACS1894111_04930 [Clostridia bacterium]|nr:hypothetical protein FACS1894111_04930 [Clostridia bacterium]